MDDGEMMGLEECEEDVVPKGQRGVSGYQGCVRRTKGIRRQQPPPAALS